MLWLFKRFVDPVAHRQESEEHRKKREVKPAEAAPDVDIVWRCRVCAYQSSAGEYCPTCLAATMEPLKT